MSYKVVLFLDYNNVDIARIEKVFDLPDVFSADCPIDAEVEIFKGSDKVEIPLLITGMDLITKEVRLSVDNFKSGDISLDDHDVSDLESVLQSSRELGWVVDVHSDGMESVLEEERATSDEVSSDSENPLSNIKVELVIMMCIVVFVNFMIPFLDSAFRLDPYNFSNLVDYLVTASKNKRDHSTAHYILSSLLTVGCIARLFFKLHKFFEFRSSQNS